MTVGSRFTFASLALTLALACGPTAAPEVGTSPHATPEPAAAPAEPATPPPEPAPTIAEEAEALVALAEALAAAHREHAGDCPGLAAALEPFAGERGAPLRAASPALLGHIDGDDALRGRLRAAMEAVMTVSLACDGDPALQAVHARLDADAPVAK